MLERWRRASLRVHLFIQLSIVLGIIVVVFLYTSIQALDASTQKALDERVIVARLMADRMDAELGHALQTLQSGLASDQLNLGDGNLEPEKKLVQSLYDHSLIFKSISLLDVSGRVLWQVPFDEQIIGVNLTEPPYSRRIFKSTQSPLSTAVDNNPSGEPTIAVTIPIVHPDGTVEGYLYGWIDLTDPRTSSILYPYQPGSNGYSDLIDQRGTVLISTLKERVGQISDHAGHLGTLIQNKEIKVGSCHSCHTPQSGGRQDDILAFAPLTNVPWGIALHEPESEVFADTRSLTYRLGVLGLIALVVFLGVVRITTGEIVRPLGELTHVARQIAGGDLSQPVPRMNVAETISLGNSFEEMRRNLLLDREQILSYQRDLEHRVEERTAELAKNQDYLLKTNRNLTELNAMAATLARSLDLTKTMNAATERVHHSMSVDACGIYLFDDREHTMTLVAPQGLPASVLPSIKCLTLSERVPPEPNGQLPSYDPSWHSACRDVLNERLQWGSLLCTPLEAEGKILGSLFVAAQQEKRFTADDESLLATVGWQVAMAVSKARMYETVEKRDRERAEMLHRVIDAQEEERKRIARELHDETSQALAALILGLDTMDAARAADPREAAALQESTKAIARQMLENIRRITADLRPALLDDMGLVPAVARYCKRRLNPWGIVLRLDADGLQGRRLPSDMEIAFFRIIQEAITNIIRHAHASTVTLQLAYRAGQVDLRIADDGQGFAPNWVQPADSQDSGFGLRGMQERVSLIGGQFDLQTAPGQGTVVTVRVPITER